MVASLVLILRTLSALQDSWSSCDPSIQRIEERLITLVVIRLITYSSVMLCALEIMLDTEIKRFVFDKRYT